ncbi:MAG: flagellar motor protein MotB [FCB group bacterium]|nr:flagellar motor protein MotB [FCB group bacterium]MBL7029450.1 flagellar motor protein MotB [Candidatus Neomarinimicrobiota bacterium]
MKLKHFLLTVSTILFFMTLIGCFGSSAELIKEKDAELEKLKLEMETLGERLEAETYQKKQLAQKKAELQQKLNSEQTTRIQKEIEIDSLENLIETESVLGSRIVLSNSVLFSSGSAELTERGKQFINEIGEVLSKHRDREVLIEGHSDNVPIGNGYRWKYSTNWELSAARAMEVLHYLGDSKMVSEDRLGVVAYGSQHPIASNKTSQGRALNRRVEIVIGEDVR